MDSEDEGGKEMRSLIVTIILASVMLLGATANFVYVNRVSDAMNEFVDAIPNVGDPLCVEKTTALCQIWEENAPLIGLSVGFQTIDKLSEHCYTLRSCAEVGDVYGYYTALALLKDSIDDVRRLEQFSIENLF